MTVCLIIQDGSYYKILTSMDNLETNKAERTTQQGFEVVGVFFFVFNVACLTTFQLYRGGQF
jgi:hypothetical protein